MKMSTTESFVRTVLAKNPNALDDNSDPQHGGFLYLRFGKGANTWILTISYRLCVDERFAQWCNGPVVVYGVSARNPKDSYDKAYGQAVAYSRRMHVEEVINVENHPLCGWFSFDTALHNGLTRKPIRRLLLDKVVQGIGSSRRLPKEMHIALNKSLAEWHLMQVSKLFTFIEEHQNV